MCGFAGVIAWDEKYRVTRDTLEKMSRAIAHRGPDGEGYHLTRENEPITPDAPQVGLAFRRLAILDPDPRSNQPFHIGPLTLVFNGEIYNFRELRSELSSLRPDYAWRTTGDTEVLLMAYEVWREKCVERLNGMFAFVVWDEQEKNLFLARDRMGQKPLYVGGTRSNGAIGFASELPALMKLRCLCRDFSTAAVKSYLRWGYMAPSETVYHAVEQLPPGTYLRLPGEGGFGSYFSSQNFSNHSDADAVSMTRQIVQQAVTRQLVSDVPLGCFLSGGVDSSIVALCMKRAASEVLTFSIGFDDPRYDETRYAAQVASYLGTKHHSFVVRPDASDVLPRLAAVFGEPFGDSSALPTHYLARETRQHVKVALSGDGGDELFGGYDRYRALLFSERLKQYEWLRALAKFLPEGHPKSRVSRLKRLLSTLGEPAALRYAGYVSLFSPTQLAELFNEDFVAPEGHPVAIAVSGRQRLVNGTNLFEIRMAAFAGFPDDPVRAAVTVDRDYYVPGDLLFKVDRCSMLHGLEVRSPFMDHELVQFAAGLTTDQLLKGGPKRMLREAFAKDLPDFVFKRKKMGFAVPIGEWFRGELRPMLRENLFAGNAFGRSHFNMKVVERLVEEHETGRVDHSQRLYALLMLELWWQQQT